MFGKFVLKLFGGSKTRKVSRKKRGGKIVLDNQKGGKIILNKKKTKKLKGGKIVLGNQKGGQCGARKLNQGGGQCGARKLNQGATPVTRREILLPRQPGVSPSRGPRPPPSYFTGMNASPKPWTRPPKGLRKKSKKKPSNTPSKPKSITPSKPKSITPSKPKSNSPSKPKSKRGKSFAARAAAMQPGNTRLHKR